MGRAFLPVSMMAAAIHEAVRLSIVPPRQMPSNGHPLLPNSGRLLVPVSEGCCRVHNANIQGIHVKIQPLFPGEAVLLFGPGGRHFGGVCNRWGPIAFAVPNDSILAYGLGLGFRVRV